MGKRIRSLRLALQMPLREFARQLGVSPAHISDIEHGRRFPSTALLLKICAQLRVSVADLESFDSRPPMDEIKRLAEADQNFNEELKALYAKWRDD